MHKNLNPLAQDLLDIMLCFNPEDRKSADDLLGHPIFEKIRDLEQEKGSDKQLNLTIDNMPQSKRTGKYEDFT